MTRFLACRIVPYLGSGEIPRRSGGKDSVIAIYQAFDTADDPITLGLGNDSSWKRFWAAVGRPERAEDKSTASNKDRRMLRAKIVAEIAALLKTRPRAHWLSVLRAARIPSGPINRLMRSAQTRFCSSADYFIVLKTVSGGFPRLGSEFVSTESRQGPAADRRCWVNIARKLLREILGYDDAKIDELRQQAYHLKEDSLAFETILYEEDGPIGTITLNRPDDGNMFTHVMCHEIRDCIESIRRETRTRVLVITGAGDRFFCIGGRKSGMEDTILYAGTLPTLEMYEAIDTLQKPVIASVNGFAVGGGNVLQVVCDLTIAKESAVFRQVGPMMGSFDAGYGTWYLEDLVGKKKAKEIWFLNPKMTAREALTLGLINKVVPDDKLKEETRSLALEICERGPFALASVKAAFNARHGGVSGLARLSHDLLLRSYLESDESQELSASFAERRKPDPSKFGR